MLERGNNEEYENLLRKTGEAGDAAAEMMLAALQTTRAAAPEHVYIIYPQKQNHFDQILMSYFCMFYK